MRVLMQRKESKEKHTFRLVKEEYVHSLKLINEIPDLVVLEICSESNIKFK